MRGIARTGASVAAIGLALLLVACSRKTPAPVVFGSDKAVFAKPSEPVPRDAQGSTPIVSGLYQVGTDETLYAISRKTGISLRDLIAANGLAPPYRLRKGQRFLVPEARYYKVSAGDTLYAISRRQNISVYALARHNGLAPPYQIRPGQHLRLPGGPTVIASNNSRPTGQLQKQSDHSGNSILVPRPKSKGASRRLALKAAPKRAGSRFAWPVRGKVISRFGAKANGLHNDGINIAVKEGTAVRAADNGVVVYAGNELRGFGNLLLLRHRGGWVTAYGHNQTLDVKVGDVVRQGQRIARAGHTGNTNRPQLHFEIRRGRRAVNPVEHLAAIQASVDRHAKAAG